MAKFKLNGNPDSKSNIRFLRGRPRENSPNQPHESRDGYQIEVLLGSTGGFDPKNTSREVSGKIFLREVIFWEFLRDARKIPEIKNLNFEIERVAMEKIRRNIKCSFIGPLPAGKGI